jgi:hypothetical protein
VGFIEMDILDIIGILDMHVNISIYLVYMRHNHSMLLADNYTVSIFIGCIGLMFHHILAVDVISRLLLVANTDSTVHVG